jgi:hypothetical protein
MNRSALIDGPRGIKRQALATLFILSRRLVVRMNGAALSRIEADGMDSGVPVFFLHAGGLERMVASPHRR